MVGSRKRSKGHALCAAMNQFGEIRPVVLSFIIDMPDGRVVDQFALLAWSWKKGAFYARVGYEISSVMQARLRPVAGSGKELEFSGELSNGRLRVGSRTFEFRGLPLEIERTGVKLNGVRSL